MVKLHKMFQVRPLRPLSILTQADKVGRKRVHHERLAPAAKELRGDDGLKDF